MTKITKYRDTKTGRFVSKTTWRRSLAKGGRRYRRTSIKRRRTVPDRKEGATPPGAVAIPPGQPIPGAMFIPPEFLEAPDMFFGGEDFGEEAEY